MADDLDRELGKLRNHVDNPPHPLRKPCVRCGEVRGRIEPTNGQDVLRCLNGHFQYNAPKTETGREVRSISSVRHTAPSQRYRLLERAHGKCELCSSPFDLHIAHFLSIKDGFDFLTDVQIESDENKAVLCAECNLGESHRSMPLWLIAGILYKRAKAS